MERLQLQLQLRIFVAHYPRTGSRAEYIPSTIHLLHHALELINSIVSAMILPITGVWLQCKS